MIPAACKLWARQEFEWSFDDSCPIERVSMFFDASDHWRGVVRCKECGQLLVDEHLEVGTFTDDEKILSMYVPVSDAELSEKAFGSLDPFDLLLFEPRLVINPEGTRAHWVR